MKSNISLEKYRIYLKGQGKKVIIPLDPKEGASWEEPDDSKAKVRQLYNVIQRNLDTIEPNDKGELDIGSLTLSDAILTPTYMIGNLKNMSHMQKIVGVLKSYQNNRQVRPR